MKKVKLSFIVCFLGAAFSLFSQTVKVTGTQKSPQVLYAIAKLKKAAEENGYKLSTNSKPDFELKLVVNPQQLGSEEFSVKVNANQIDIVAGDERGLIYGCQSVAEDLRNGIGLKKLKSRTEKPHYSLRAVKFDLPWDTYRHSYALDLHYETCRDTAYWKAFLDMMSENRLNSLSLWNLHPYTFMIKPKNFPEASPFSDSEMKEWKNLFTAIFRMAKERAIETYIIPFNIFVSPEFSKAHNVNMDNLDHHFYVKGDTSALVKRYTRECVTQMLQEYPDITGMGLTLGEGMGEMTPLQREDWMRETIIEGMKLSGRKLKLIHRIPFSSTTSSLGVTSIETEKMTRKIIEEEGTYPFLQKPIYADLKYNWSHAHSTPKLIKVHGGKLYDTYFVPEPETYKITWTARNEDFFCLRWGVPSFVRQHIAANNQNYVGGYFIGSETYIPAKDYFTNPEIKVDWKYAFERQWLYYKIWGRLLYNPDTPDEIFQDEFTRRYGKAGESLLKASSLAGATPLRLASLFDFTFDLSFYSEGFMAIDDKVKRLEYISADRLINQPVTDPDYVSVKEYVDATMSGKPFGANRITPPILCESLERDCNEAIRLVKNIDTKNNTALMFEVADIQTWANLGLHLAEKLKGTVALQTYRIKGGEHNRLQAIDHFEKALGYWDKVISITRPIYRNMPLVHLSEQNGVRTKENQFLEFHWEKLRPDVAKDIETAKKQTTK